MGDIQREGMVATILKRSLRENPSGKHEGVGRVGVVGPAGPPPLRGHMSSSLCTSLLVHLKLYTFSRLYPLRPLEPATCSGHSVNSSVVV